MRWGERSFARRGCVDGRTCGSLCFRTTTNDDAQNASMANGNCDTKVRYEYRGSFCELRHVGFVVFGVYWWCGYVTVPSTFVRKKEYGGRIVSHSSFFDADAAEIRVGWHGVNYGDPIHQDMVWAEETHRRFVDAIIDEAEARAVGTDLRADVAEIFHPRSDVFDVVVAVVPPSEDPPIPTKGFPVDDFVEYFRFVRRRMGMRDVARAAKFAYSALERKIALRVDCPSTRYVDANGEDALLGRMREHLVDKYGEEFERDFDDEEMKRARVAVRSCFVDVPISSIA